jgi:hypothetical protein
VPAEPGKKLVSATDDVRAAVVLVIYGRGLSDANLARLKAFVGARPWRRGFSFASHLAVDALLLHAQDAARDARYQNYDIAEMEAARARHAQ